MKKILVQFTPNCCMIVYQSHRDYTFGEKSNTVKLSKNIQIISSSHPDIENIHNYYFKWYVKGRDHSKDWNIILINLFQRKRVAYLMRYYNRNFRDSK